MMFVANQPRPLILAFTLEFRKDIPPRAIESVGARIGGGGVGITFGTNLTLPITLPITFSAYKDLVPHGYTNGIADSDELLSR